MCTTWKRFCIVVFAVLLMFASVTVGTVQAASAPKAPKLSSWKKLKPKNQEGDGVTWRVTWKKVKGAKGYQIKYYEKGAPSDKWYAYKATTKKCRADISFSSLYQFKVKVRAYKIGKNGKKVYGKWASSKVKRVTY